MLLIPPDKMHNAGMVGIDRLLAPRLPVHQEQVAAHEPPIAAHGFGEREPRPRGGPDRPPELIRRRIDNRFLRTLDINEIELGHIPGALGVRL
jgi:hypothetical protein